MAQKIGKTEPQKETEGAQQSAGTGIGQASPHPRLTKRDSRMVQGKWPSHEDSRNAGQSRAPVRGRLRKSG